MSKQKKRMAKKMATAEQNLTNSHRQNNISIAIADGDVVKTDRYKQACRRLGVNFKSIRLDGDDWETVLKSSDCNIFLWHPPTPRGNADYIWEKAKFCEEQLDKKFFPTAEMSFFYQDKSRQSILFDQLKLPQPLTFITKDRKQSEKFIKSAKYPLVLKDPHGSGGVSCLKLNNYQEAKEANDRLFSTQEKDSPTIIAYWQEFIIIKKEFRIITIKNKIVFSYRREPARDNWISNLNMGGKAVYENAPIQVAKVVQRFINNKPWPWNAFDVAITRSGQVKLIEINPTFGDQAMYQAKFDIRKKQVETILEILEENTWEK